MSEALAETLERAASALRRRRPALAHDLTMEAAARIASGSDLDEVRHWHLRCIVDELFGNDGAAFGSVQDGDEPAPTPPHAGGRPKLMGDDEAKRFMRHMVTAGGTVKARIRSFRERAPWCEVSDEQLAAQWRNRAKAI